MGLGGCYGCIKYLIFGFNFLFWLMGCAVLGFGIWVRVDPQFHKFASDSNFGQLYIGAYILMVIGCLVMIVGFLGCCGTIRESQCMLSLFFVCLFVIFSVMLAGGVWAIVSKNQLKEKVTEALDKSVRDYYKTDAAREMMDHVQQTFSCCGASGGAKDYGNQDTPDSCALENRMKPCNQKLFDFFRNNFIIIAGFAIGIALVMVVGMIFSCCLCCAIRQESRQTRYRYT